MKYRRFTLDDAAAFHGHKGPWLTLGYLAGGHALRVLQPRDEFDLSCVVKTPLKKPYTCAADGIQVSTGCTLGKLSITLEHVDEASATSYIFTNARTGKKLELKLKPHVCEEIERLSGVKGMEEISEWVISQPISDLFKEEQ